MTHRRRMFWGQWGLGLAVLCALPQLGLAASAKQTVDVHKSRVYIFVGKTGLGHEHAVEGKFRSGSISIGAEKQAGEFVFDMASFRADTQAARRYLGLEGTTSQSTQRQVNANMLGAKVLDVSRYPTARFQIDTAKLLNRSSRSGHPLVDLSGRFTLHGKTHRIHFLGEMVRKDKELHVRGGFRILQSDYGIKPFSKAFGAIGVADELRIYGDVVLTDAAAAQSARQATNQGRRQ